MNPDSTLAVTKTCPKDGVHLCAIVTGFLCWLSFAIWRGVAHVRGRRLTPV